MATGNSIVFFYVTERGRRLAETLGTALPGRREEALFNGRGQGRAGESGGRLVFIMAAGIVVRTIAPLLTDKRTDPAVVVLDELGAHVVSLLSGHLGGANALAAEIARLTGGTRRHHHRIGRERPSRPRPLGGRRGPRHRGLEAPSEGRERNWWIKKTLRLFSDVPLDAPEAFLPTEDPAHGGHRRHEQGGAGA